MALSIYPRAIPAFPNHRNLLDDVDASHVNNIQTELTAVAYSVGVNPSLYNDVSLSTVVTTGSEGDTGSVEDTPTDPGAPRSYDPKISIVDHGTVAKRLDYLEQGQQHHFFSLRASGVDINSSDTSMSASLKAIRFPKPTAKKDPAELFSGAGANLRKSGFYIFNAVIIFNLLGSTDLSNSGTYVGGIAVDGDWVPGSAKQVISNVSSTVHLHMTLSDYFSRGANIRLRVAQNSGRQQRIRLASLSGALLRESIEG